MGRRVAGGTASAERYPHTDVIAQSLITRQTPHARHTIASGDE